MKHKKKPYYQKKVFKRKTGGPKFDRRRTPQSVGFGSTHVETRNMLKSIMKFLIPGIQGNR